MDAAAGAQAKVVTEPLPRVRWGRPERTECGSERLAAWVRALSDGKKVCRTLLLHKSGREANDWRRAGEGSTDQIGMPLAQPRRKHTAI